MTIKIYLDGADLDSIARLAPTVDGVTTNPSIMRKAGITDYRQFAREVLARIDGKPVSFEVLADDAIDMCEQAQVIAAWAPNVYVKIPIVSRFGVLNSSPIKILSKMGIKLNVTAIMTQAQVELARTSLINENHIISIFAGRIGDAGYDVAQIVRYATQPLIKKGQVLWASTRDIYSVLLAQMCGCDIITLPPDMIDKKRLLAGKDLDVYSRETAQMFFNDAKGITL